MPDTLTEQEALSLRTFASQGYVRDWMMITLALGTGLRNSELINLTIECFRPYDEISNFIELPASIAKGARSRQIPLRADLRESLQNFMQWKFHQGEILAGSSLLFVSKFTHNRLNPRDFQRMLKSLSMQAIGRSINPHVLRHTFATNLLKVSNMRIVQKALGHKYISTTQIYTHPSNDEISEAFNNLPGQLS